MRTETVNFFAELFGKTKGAAVPGDPLTGAETMNLDSTRHTETVQQVDYTAVSKDSGFKKKLRWEIKNKSTEPKRWIVTPEMAAVMLSWNDRNRPLTASKAKKYANTMASGDWRYNGVPIIFSAERLIDGQHRLSGCIESGVAFETLVVFGAPDDAFDTIDIGKARTASDIFGIHGVQNSTICSAATKWVYEYEHNMLAANGGGVEFSHALLHTYFLNNPTIADSVWVAIVFKKSRLAMPSIMMGVHFVAARKSRKEADEFFRKVGEGLGFTGKKDPAYRLHHRLIEGATSQEKMGRKQVAALTIKAWNAHRLGRDVGTLKYSVNESFPKVI